MKDYRWLRQVYLTDVVHVSLLNRRQYARIMSEVPDIAGKYYFVELIKYVIPYLKCFWHSATKRAREKRAKSLGPYCVSPGQPTRCLAHQKNYFFHLKSYLIDVKPSGSTGKGS